MHTQSNWAKATRALACLAVFSIHVTAAIAACPDGTSLQANSCVLKADLQIGTTLELAESTTLNCRGHRILPVSAGSGSTEGDYVPSVPSTAIAITGQGKVDIRNCIIGEADARFDFGIIAMNSKNAGAAGHRIHGNEINARDSGVMLVHVDDMRVNDNVITWTNGFGISFARDSDRNHISGNLLASPGSPAATVRIAPGGPFRTGNDDAIFLSDLQLFPLFNIVIGGKLYQFPNSTDGSYGSVDDNVIEDNQMSLPGSSLGKSHTGTLVSGNAQRTRLSGNLVSQAATGIRLAGLMPAQPVTRPARCTLASERFCMTDSDCYLPEIDVAPLGVCPLPTTDVRDLRGRDTVVEGNAFAGPFNATQVAQRAAIFGGNGTVDGIIRGNLVLGAGGESGISISGEMLQSAVLTGNRVQGAAFGLMLQQGSATNFGTRVSANDFTGNTTRAIGVVGAYTLTTELSWQGVGNYWGYATPPCFHASDSPSVLIQDSFALCAPVAASVEALPSPTAK